MEELEMTSYKNDTSANAVVLGDCGTLYFKYNQSTQDWNIVFDRHRRIKILKKSGYGWADHKVMLYNHGTLSERISSIKGCTYNLVDGKIEKEKLTKKSQFKENVSEYYNSFKLTMPNVVEGSIIEYRYTIISNYTFQLPNWQFQYSIPVIWSEYNVTIPEYFKYKQLMKGYEQLAFNEKTAGTGSITFSSNERTSDPGAKAQFSTNTIRFETEKYRMVAATMPAFITEPMITTADNYISSIDYELAVTQMPNSKLRNYTATWESINKSLLNNEDFGGQLSGGAFLNKDIDEINAKFSQPVEKMYAIYDFVQKHMKWDNTNSKYVTTNLRSAFNDKSGSSGDINLLLTLMLRKAGLNANPVILSTRANGIVNPGFPMLTQFNYVISQVVIGKDTYLLDATDPLCPSNLLPTRCLNGNGRLVSEKGSDWVSLNPGKAFIYSCTANLNLDRDGVMIGKMIIDRQDYAAYSLRKKLESEKSVGKYIEGLENSNNGLTIDDHVHINVDSIYNPTKEEYNVTIEDQARIAGDFIYVSPLLYEQMENNPFKLQDRKYPVDYSYPRNETFKLTLNIPDGYRVEEVPENKQLNLPNNSATFKFRIIVEGNKIQLENNFSVNKSHFIYNEYKSLKQFYADIVEKHAEPLILKKTSE